MFIQGCTCAAALNDLTHKIKFIHSREITKWFTEAINQTIAVKSNSRTLRETEQSCTIVFVFYF